VNGKQGIIRVPVAVRDVSMLAKETYRIEDPCTRIEELCIECWYTVFVDTNLFYTRSYDYASSTFIIRECFSCTVLSSFW
jgi:hypothetical protein